MSVKRGSVLYDTRTVHFEVKSDSLDDMGTFVGFANVYGNEDLVGDVVDRGAFTKTIAERPTVKILFNHNPNCPIGLGTLEDSDIGLVLKGRLNLDTQLGREVYSNLRLGILDSLSIGYEVVKKATEAGLRHLKEVKVYEVSVVTFPANPMAQIVGVKAADFYALPAGDVFAIAASRASQLLDELLAAPTAERKAGRVLSSANLSLAEAAINALSALVAAGRPAAPAQEDDAEKAADVLCETCGHADHEGEKCASCDCVATNSKAAGSGPTGDSGPASAGHPGAAADPHTLPTPGTEPGSKAAIEPEILHSWRAQIDTMRQGAKALLHR